MEEARIENGLHAEIKTLCLLGTAGHPTSRHPSLWQRLLHLTYLIWTNHVMISTEKQKNMRPCGLTSITGETKSTQTSLGWRPRHPYIWFGRTYNPTSVVGRTAKSLVAMFCTTLKGLQQHNDRVVEGQIIYIANHFSAHQEVPVQPSFHHSLV